MTKFWCIAFILLFQFIGKETTANQQVKLDSLKTILLTHNDAQARTDAGIEFANRIVHQHYDSTYWALDQVIEACQELGYTQGVAKASTEKAWFLMGQVNNEEALRCAYKALQIHEKDNSDSLELAKTISMLGSIHLGLDQFQEAENYMLKALKIIRAIGDTVRIDRALNNLGAVYEGLNQPNKAIENYKKSRKLRVDLKDYQRVAYSDFNLGLVYLQLSKLDSAGFYLNRSAQIFSEQTKRKTIPDLIHFGLGEFYLTKKDFNKAIHHTNIGLKKSIEAGYSDRWVEGYDLLSKALFKQGKTDSAYSVLRIRVTIADSLRRINNMQAMAQMEKRYKNASLEKELVEAKAENLEYENSLLTMRIYNWGLIGGAVLLVLTVVIFSWIRIQKKQVYEANLQKELASSKLTALRSQMNSHFIFNCINTAQNFVLHEQKEKSYEYLSRFAQLLRRVLENSNSNFIALEDEINLIENYLEIESTRFDNKFSYEIIIDEKLKNEVFEIPSMIIQPFIENAIIHGINNLEKRKGQLKILLTLKQEQVYCSITDNGVGRSKAQKIKAHKQKQYASLAISNIKNRLGLFQQKGEAQVDFTITDLFDKNQVPMGTCVKIWLPFQ